MPNRRRTDTPGETPARSLPTHQPSGLRNLEGNAKVIGEAATASPGAITEVDNGGDWMDERILSPDDLPAEQAGAAAGVPVSTRSARGTRKGKAIESKRGQR